MKSDILNKLVQVSVGLVVIFLMTLIANASWIPPSQPPPNANVSQPLNVSGTTQTKTGKLNFTWFEDQDQPGYYVDPGSNSWLYRLYSYDIRSDIFYDRNNTGYYVDPNAATAANLAGGINIDGNTVIDDGAGWHRTYGQTGWYNGTYGGGWFMEDTTWLRAYNNKGVYTGGQMRADAGFCIGGSCLTSWPTSPSETDPVFIASKGANVYACPLIVPGYCYFSWTGCNGQYGNSTICYVNDCGAVYTSSCSYVGRLVN
ncbi:MAG: hypothetical protein A2931_00340 [Candidatus Niyogibacteria bacterium RIFCSPLOWO2_01_FULL_45_48]|uniref:Bacterial shufflon protein N-terminal domain-containing protein n=2 Tax=Candidatus Niyogiibacteriota TaxID=1817912 RepID=A0A1G2EZ95_9BACT|nr:MAG: hypothetical protein A2931_00340 [Candidatus Niyogibacteria bacterium RIFCSPLOWO2_01_FULL_45_48]OGZ30620.1 MAG: hypothetical protein A2835_03555 [Candidatus Niyogibacteria bacterium RIFCSPHIGHO2_01_FULL_45_28]OGZ31119.1 MAG: hypothetical protein A3J00_03320 [Candidatus Niyogibacteria bacterium RIFCSPLOWO2_02_FULL_45_13]